MMRKLGSVSLLVVACVAMPALGQDSVSVTPGLPGDGVSPWADATAAFGSEQCNDYIVDMDEFQTSWGTTFGIAPLAKTSKTSSNYFGSLWSAQAMSTLQETRVPAFRSSYDFWKDPAALPIPPGHGVNNDPAINLPGVPINTSDMLSNQFGAVMSEYSTTDEGESYGGIIGTVVNYHALAPKRLYVSRVVAAANSCDSASNLSQFGIGSVDETGAVHFRADDFGVTGGCGLNPLVANNYFRVRMAQRNCNVLNVVSDDYDGTGGLFDLPATDWLLRRVNGDVSRRHNTPKIMPTAVGGAPPILLGSDWSNQYVRGPAFPLTADGSHLAAGVTGHVGNVAYTAENCAWLGSTHGIAALIGHDTNFNATIMNIWGLDAAANVTGTVALSLPAAIVDNDDGWSPANLGIEFDHYHSQTWSRGGNGQVALGVDQEGNLLAAAEADHPFDSGYTHPDNFIPVAKLDCATGQVVWTVAGYCGRDSVSGVPFGKAIKDGPGGNAIGRMIPMDISTSGAVVGPSISAPAMDSVGNIWFLSRVELFPDQRYNTALLRAVYHPGTFSYELELVLKLGDVFLGQNSGCDYLLSFLAIADSNSVDSGTMWSNNVSETGHLGRDTSDLATADPDTLGGLVFAAEAIYDWDKDGVFDASLGIDQDYDILFYIGSVTQGGPCGDLDLDGDVDLTDFGIFASCFAGSDNPPQPGCPVGLAADCDGDGDVDLTDFGIFGNNFTGSL